MPDLAELLNKHKVEEDDMLEILDHVKKSGNEKDGIASYLKSLEDNLEDLRFQLKAKGSSVDKVVA